MKLRGLPDVIVYVLGIDADGWEKTMALLVFCYFFSDSRLSILPLR